MIWAKTTDKERKKMVEIGFNYCEGVNRISVVAVAVATSCNVCSEWVDLLLLLCEMHLSVCKINATHILKWRKMLTSVRLAGETITATKNVASSTYVHGAYLIVQCTYIFMYIYPIDVRLLSSNNTHTHTHVAHTWAMNKHIHRVFYS